MATKRLDPRTAFLAVPLILVNSGAGYGQAGWFYEYIFHNWFIAGILAATIESIGVYLAAEAHGALMAGDASIRLRVGSYLIGALVGLLNYAHFASVGYRPNPVALTFGLLSSISPWLWAIRSRSLNRDRLRELGQIDPRAVRFSLLRWALYPARTFRAFRVAVWCGIVQPLEAINAAEPQADDIEEQETVSDMAGEAVKPKRKRRPMTTPERIAKVQKLNPGIGVSDIAARLRLSEKTVSRAIKSVNGAKVLDEVMPR